MGDDRRQYRHYPDYKGQLSVVVVVAQERRAPQRIFNLSVGGMGVFFEHEHDPVYGLGSTVYVHMESPYLEGTLIAPCLVGHRMEMEGGRVYGFTFVDWIGLLSQIPRELAALFNQRGECRVEPLPDEPISITVEVPEGQDDETSSEESAEEPIEEPNDPRGEEPGEDEEQGGARDEKLVSVEAEVHDFSPEGVSFRAGVDAEYVLSGSEQVRLTFTLPGDDEPLVLWAHILRRDLVGDHICYGTYLDEERTEDFKEQQLRLLRYATEVQRQSQGSLQS
ncbi:MAG: PilZ domain-containing protein [Planctomycetota bacterium]|nr:PilZ domain-containing protein [Planctomycetota bacterium]